MDTKLIHRNLLYFYTLTKISEREINETIIFTITSKIIKYTGINLQKEVKDLYFKNYKMVMKKNFLTINRWKGNCVLELEESVLLNDILSKEIY